MRRLAGYRGNRLRVVLAIVFFGIAGMLPAGAGAIAGGTEAEAFVRDLASNAVAMVGRDNQTESEREAEFRQIVRRGFALDLIGRFVVGRYWREMTEAQQREYQDLFAEWLLKSYAGRLGGYRGQSLEIVKSVDAGTRDVFVRTHVIRPDGPPIAADWRVRDFDGDYKIIDVVVEGVSMATTQKSEFESVIRRVGVEGLLETLRDRLALLIAGSG